MNEGILRTLTEKCNEGIFATAAEVIDSLTIPHVKSSRPYSTYEGRLGQLYLFDILFFGHLSQIETEIRLLTKPLLLELGSGKVYRDID